MYKMPRYKSRIGPGGAVKPREKKRRVKRAIPVVLMDDEDSVAPGGSLAPVGGVISAGGTVDVDTVSYPQRNKRAGALRTGGAAGGSVSSGGTLGPTAVDVDTVSYPQMYHILGHMGGDEFHTLQGLAAAHLPNVSHPLKLPVMKALGGSFIHPRTISKMATQDIMKAPSPQMLSQALYHEYLDSLSGRDTGGGLFDSLKNVLKKGTRVAAKGAKGALGIANKLKTAIKRGTDIAKTFQEPLSGLSPALGEILSKGIGTAEAIERGLATGVASGEKISQGLDILDQAVNE